MKLKHLCITVVMLNCIAFQGYAQNPVIQNILSDVEIDSMTHFVSQLTGEEQVLSLIHI